MKVRFTSPALADLEGIYQYIAKADPAAASRVVARLMDRALALGQTPYEGREADELNVRVLLIPRYRYFIFYRIEREEIQITHIRHTSRRRLGEAPLSDD